MAKRISLILGSGGARGLAHIGVIHELERRGIEIGAVVGCSMGALVGGLYAAGKLTEFKDWVGGLSQWDVFRFLDISLTSRVGMMKGDLIMEHLRTLVGDRKIEELPLPFTAVAIDIFEQKEIWLNRGDLFDAIRASIAIPGLFTPKVIGGRTMVDGGLLNPVPVAPATSNDTTLTLAVSLSGRRVSEPLGPNLAAPPAPTLGRYRQNVDDFLNRVQNMLGLEHREDESPAVHEPTLTDVMLGTFDTMQATIARYRLAAYPPDLLIEIPTNICETHEFHKAVPAISAGQYWADRVLSEHAQMF